MPYAVPMPKSSNEKPLPLSDTLRDLALLRASEIDLASCIPVSTSKETEPEKELSVVRSHEFVEEARAALRILNRGVVDKEGAKIDELRNDLEETIIGIESNPQR